MIGYDISRSCWHCAFSLFQPISLGIFRSDYLIDKADDLHERCSDSFGVVTPKQPNGSISIKQVEMNTISLGGITFSCFVPKMHRYRSERGVRPARIQIQSNSARLFIIIFIGVLLIFIDILTKAKPNLPKNKAHHVEDWFEVHNGRWFFI